MPPAFQSVKEPPNRQNEFFIIKKQRNRRDRALPCPNTGGFDNPCVARHFDLLHKSNPTVLPVRRRVRFVCLWRFFDLCQSVKNYFFDRLGRWRLPQAFQSVKEPPNRQNEFFIIKKQRNRRDRALPCPNTGGFDNPCVARHFDLLHKSNPTVLPVRRRVRFVCLWRFFDLCQSVKNYFFDRLSRWRCHRLFVGKLEFIVINCYNSCFFKKSESSVPTSRCSTAFIMASVWKEHPVSASVSFSARDASMASV